MPLATVKACTLFAPSLRFARAVRPLKWTTMYKCVSRQTPVVDGSEIAYLEVKAICLSGKEMGFEAGGRKWFVNE
jgi:hypothetical protein